MTEDLENTLCICGAQDCEGHTLTSRPMTDPEAYIEQELSLKGLFDMDITREQALFIMAAGLSECPLWSLMCYEYGRDNKTKDDHTWEGLADEDFDSIREDPSYQHFALWLTPQPSKEVRQ